MAALSPFLAPSGRLPSRGIPRDCCRDFSGFLKSAEFRKIDNLIEQILFFREEAHKLSWEILSTDLKKPGSILWDCIKRYSKDQASDPNADDARRQFTSPGTGSLGGKSATSRRIYVTRGLKGDTRQPTWAVWKPRDATSIRRTSIDTFQS
jgi:hypothetical protein